VSQPKVRFKRRGDLLEVVEGGAIDIASGEFKIGGVTVTASAAELNVAAGAAIPDAVDVPIADAGNRYTAENVEAALQEIAGAGRTNETVKGAMDAAGAAAGVAAAAYVKPGTGIPVGDLAAEAQASLALADTALQPGEPLNITAGTPVNAVAASKVLAITGVVIHGETVVVGDETYEFVADDAQSVSDPANIPVDIQADTVKAQGTLTVDTNPVSGDTFTIGEKVFTIVPAGTASGEGQVNRGGNVGTTQENIVAAINGTDGHNTPHPLVSAAAFGGDACVITALVGGVAGNSIATTQTFTAGSNVFDAATLGTTTAGVDCADTDAATALVAAITAESAIAAAVADGANVTVSAQVKGVSGNSIAISETMDNGAWAGAATELSGGVDGTVGVARQVVMDSSWLYVCTAVNTIADANWRRITLGTVY
jgi:hypothetical protein